MKLTITDRDRANARNWNTAPIYSNEDGSLVAYLRKDGFIVLHRENAFGKAHYPETLSISEAEQRIDKIQAGGKEEK